MRELRAKHKNRQRKERKLINPVTTPQYDDTYYEIITWLDSLAGEPFSEGEYIVKISKNRRKQENGRSVLWRLKKLHLKSPKRSIKNEALNNTQIWTASSW